MTTYNGTEENSVCGRDKDMAYTKNVAVIKGVKDGFSADGGALSGLIKAERYSQNLNVEVSLINFAPLTEGRYVCAVSDGTHFEIIENCAFSGQSQVDTDGGFGAVVCYVNDGVQVIATAVCGNNRSALFGLKGEIEKAEKFKINPDGGKEGDTKPAAAYEDEAIADVNYYEFGKTDEGGRFVFQDEKEAPQGDTLRADEKDAGDVKDESFYKKMKKEIDKVLSAYPKEETLCAAIEGSEWVKISYGDGAFYVFGVIKEGGVPRYLCYGIPATDDITPPSSMSGLAAFLEVPDGGYAGYWVIYQDASTGETPANVG